MTYLRPILLPCVLLLGSTAGSYAQFWGDTLELPPFHYQEDRANSRPGTKQKPLSQGELKHYQNQNLSDAMAYETPAYIKSYGPGGLATPSFRGTGAGHTQVSWNGIPLNSPMNGQVDLNLIPMALMDGASVQYGAGSVADRPGGLGGRINLQQYPQWSATPKFELSQQLGSFHRQQTRASIQLGDQHWHSQTQLFFRDYENDFEYRDITERGKPLKEQSHAAQQQYGLMQETYYRPDTSNLFSLHAWLQDSDREIPPPMTVANKQQEQADQQGRFVGKWQHYGPSSLLEVRSAFLSHKLHYTDDKVGIDALHRSRSWMNSATYTYYLSADQQLKGGLTYDYHWADSDGFEGNKTQLRASAYASYRQQWADWLKVRLRLQQEHVNNRFTPLMPTAGFTLQPFDQPDLRLKASVYRNYKVPTLNDLYWASGGNPDLKPENGWGQEAGIHYGWASGQNGLFQELEASVTAYHGLYDQWIQWTPNPAGLWEARNIQQVRTQGVETELTTAWRMGTVTAELGGSYSYTSSRNLNSKSVADEAAGRQLIYVPFHKVRAHGQLQWQEVILRYRHRVVGRRYVTRDHSRSLAPYDRANVSLRKPFELEPVTLTAQVKVQNLFDEQYQEMAWRPMPGRSFFLSLNLAYQPDS